MSNDKLAKIPVILDTDIGTDIDDTWTLGMILKCPELDIKLITSCTSDTHYRAKLIAKFLEKTGNATIPIGIGIKQDDKIGPLAQWVEDYSLDDYPDTIHEDGIQAMVDVISSSSEQITIIAIGPLTNIGALLEKKPDVTNNTRFIGMQGSLRKGYIGRHPKGAEYNTMYDAPASQRVFQADWEKIITPLDTCGRVALKKEKYQKILDSEDIICKTIIEQYKIWHKEFPLGKIYNPKKRSSTLFDTVAVYLAFQQDLCKMESLGIRVTEKGKTFIDENSPKVLCATEWKDLKAFEDLLVERLLS
ncbi:MAG: hypothetical protein GY870_02010 [archaeon]|nr:hypothetical protein [archaeon]